MTEHTPGPWEVGWHDRGLGHGDYVVVGESGQLIAEVTTGLAVDARLLAAAPDLLEACKQVMATYGVAWSQDGSMDEQNFVLSRSALKQIDAAIAKAELKE